MISVFKNINRFAKRWKFLDLVAIFCARILPYVLVLFLLGFAFWIKSWQVFVFPILSGGLARFLNEVVHIFYKKERPAYLTNANVLIPVPKNYSFPSGHASFFFGLSFSILQFNKILGIIFLACSLVMGFARVFCGVHWFKDILAGVVIGFISALFILFLIS